jgi:hypothetical protein
MCAELATSLSVYPSTVAYNVCCATSTQAGSELAAEKAQFESRLRRIKLACSRWKVAYQKDVHERYQQMASALEDRYMR